MDKETEMTEKDLLNACAILVILKDGGEFLTSAIQRKSGLTSRQTIRLLKFLSERFYIIPRVVPKKNRLMVKYGKSKRGMAFLRDTLIVCGGLNQKITFSLYGKELNEAMKFRRDHPCKLKTDPETGAKRTGAIGGEASYRFTPTSLGIAVTVLCACGKEKNVTDYDGW